MSNILLLKNKIITKKPLQMCAVKLKFTGLHSILHKHQTKTLIQKILDKPEKVFELKETTKNQLKIYLALQNLKKRKKIDLSFLNEVESTNKKIKFIKNIILGQQDALIRLKNEDYYGYLMICTLFNKENDSKLLLDYYNERNEDYKFNSKLLKNHTYFIEYVNNNIDQMIDYFLAENMEKHLNIIIALSYHKHFCLLQKEVDIISSFKIEYEKLLKSIYSKNPKQKFNFDHNNYDELKLFNAYIDMKNNIKGIDKKLLKHENFTTYNERGIKKFVVEEIRKMKNAN